MTGVKDPTFVLGNSWGTFDGLKDGRWVNLYAVSDAPPQDPEDISASWLDKPNHALAGEGTQGTGPFRVRVPPVHAGMYLIEMSFNFRDQRSRYPTYCVPIGVR